MSQLDKQGEELIRQRFEAAFNTPAMNVSIMAPIANSLERREDGLYKQIAVEAMWRGFRAASSSCTDIEALRRAVEHGGYLATSAERFLAAYNRVAELELGEDAPDPVALEQAESARSDHYKDVENAIYEFRKRAALSAVPESEATFPKGADAQVAQATAADIDRIRAETRQAAHTNITVGSPQSASAATFPTGWIREAADVLHNLRRREQGLKTGTLERVDALLAGVPCPPKDLEFDSPADREARSSSVAKVRPLDVELAAFTLRQDRLARETGTEGHPATGTELILARALLSAVSATEAHK